MIDAIPGISARNPIPVPLSKWLELILSSPVVRWCGWRFFVRGWRSVVTRNLNMFTSIALGVGVAYGYSTVAVLFPAIFADSAQIGLLFAACSAAMIVIQGLLFSMLVKHVPSGWLIGPGLGSMVLGLTFMPFTADCSRLLLLGMLIAAGTSVVAPMITYWASLGAGLAQGPALGTQTAASSLGQALGSAAVAALSGLWAAAPFWLAHTFLVAGATLFVTSGAVRQPFVTAA